jgi:DNA-binding winged helix-turn-helix (wHTH) protein
LIGFRMKMDMRPSVVREQQASHKAPMKATPSLAEEVLKGANINGLRADTAGVGPMAAERVPLVFGPFVFDRESRLLARDGVEIPLPPRVLGVLALLLERPGQLVTKQELMSAVWRDAFVTETSLAEAVSVLRQTLGDDPQRPTYIQTLHRRGYRFIAEVKQESSASFAPAESSVESDRRSLVQEPEPPLWLLLPWLTTFFALVIAAIAVWKYVNVAEPPARPAARFTLALPEDVTLAATGAPLAVSRDGGMLAFAGCRSGECGIYLRPLAQAEPTFVAGTAGGAAPFFSPDGRWLGYFALGQLHKIALGGGSPIALAPAPAALGATWTRDGRIVFANSTHAGLSMIPENGGEVRSLTEAAAGGHRWPEALPDGSAVVFTVAETAHGRHYAGIVSLRTRAWGRLLDDVSAVRAPIPGYLVAQRGADLLGVTFDRRALSVSGLAVPVAANVVRADGDDGLPQFATSEAGLLVIGAPASAEIHVALDWHGELRRLVPPPAPTLPR